MNPLFSERYEDLILVYDLELTDESIDAIPFDAKLGLSHVMLDFCEPQEIQVSRYDYRTVTVDALELAVKELNNRLKKKILDLSSIAYLSESTMPHAFASVFTPHLFDLIELQYAMLSDDPENGKEGFRKEINGVFEDQDLPWLLVDGRLIKIDAKQFEQDLKLKAIEQMQELQDASSAFQSAYDELVKAVEHLDRGDYTDAVINANKSYESVMKVICGENEKSAGALAGLIANDENLNLPDGIDPGAFKEKVLMSLPYIRNHAAAHGAGQRSSQADRALANLAVNLSCALSTFLIQETKDRL